ncbi:MAG: UDP-N-acetylglucosamine 2-epimerase (non-hydrolyzing) [Bryobacteraceae bacterium]
MLHVLFVFGTRPEAIKLAPLIRHLRSDGRFRVSICVTAQHRGLLDQVLGAFEIIPDFDLDLMTPGQTLGSSSARILAGLDPVLRDARPDLVLVQGDTTTTLCGALAAFYARIPVGHVEAGLRTYDLGQPFPEEMNRVLTTRMAALHFAATAGAAEALRKEQVPDAAITVTGNTGIDAVLYVRDALERGDITSELPIALDPAKRLIVVTAHRRESFGAGFDEICAALAELSERPDVQIVYPVHPNPNVRTAVDRWLLGRDAIQLIEPLAYVPFIDLLRRAHMILTDSGGIQEEAPSLGKPVLVLRDTTERPEGIAAGTAELTGANRERIVRAAQRLLDDPAEYARRSGVHNPYGDGSASVRIANAIVSFFER